MNGEDGQPKSYLYPDKGHFNIVKLEIKKIILFKFSNLISGRVSVLRGVL